jgi:arginyl-tRNA synthetase
MTDPQHEIENRFAVALASGFGDQGARTDPLIRPSAFADFQSNIALSLAKRLGSSPREVATRLVEHLDSSDVFEQVTVSGPGFINVTLQSDWLARQATALLMDEDVGLTRARHRQTVVVDYSAPNVAKEMHVGHLRTTIVGDALARVLKHRGHVVLRQNHVGDWGTPFGMLIEHLLDVGIETAVDQLSVGELNSFYQQARTKFDNDPKFAERARARVVMLQQGDAQTLRWWRLLVDASMAYFEKVYDRLGVLLGDADIRGESFYNPLLEQVADELAAAGVAAESEGALVAFPPDFTGRAGQPAALVIRKRDGGFGYAATDLAAVRHRTTELHADRLIYVVGVSQAMHLAMVFAVARQMGWLNGAQAEHAAIGSVLGQDGRLLRTRSSAPPKLVELLDEAVERAGKLLTDRGDLTEDQRAAIARAVGIGAVKYADLSVSRDRDYVFDWDRLLSLDGNTGPYLQYATARIRSIFRRAGLSQEAARVPPIRIGHDAERVLVLRLLGFGTVVHEVADTLQPHRLTNYLYDLAVAFTGFYEHCPILTAPDESIRRSRLALCVVTEQVLTTGLTLLGIEVPDRM